MVVVLKIMLFLRWLGGGGGGGAPLGLKGIGGQIFCIRKYYSSVGGDGSDAIGFIGGIGEHLIRVDTTVEKAAILAKMAKQAI